MAAHGGHQGEKSDLPIGMMGLGIGVAWVLVVCAIGYWLALTLH